MSFSWWSGGGGGGGLLVLTRPTPIFGLRLWILILIAAGASLLLLLLLLLPFLLLRRRRRPSPSSSSFSSSKPLRLHLHDPNPPLSKEILEIVHHPPPAEAKTISPPAASGTSTTTTTTAAEETRPTPEVSNSHSHSHLGWGHWYTLRELHDATGGLADHNIVGEGGYGIVYRGVLPDGTTVAIKNLLNNRGQAEKEFRVEVEAIGRVRHKNLVRLLGYCVEGAYRMLVYEFLDNGNLDQWLHGDVGEVSPLSWEVRMNIILGTARGLAYLHEGLEPKVIHRDVKSSNILLDRQWNPMVSDFGLAKLLCSERSYVTTRVMGTFGYVAPEYASTGMLNEKSDVYSFGVLIMEIISARSPVDYARPPGEVNLVEWLKTMVGDRKSEEMVDPRMPEMPSSKTLKRVLLVALRCVDPDASKRPKMGHLIHMLEADDLLSREDRKLGRETAGLNHDYLHGKQSLERYNEDKSFHNNDHRTLWS